jgi:hypothetical protein
MRKKAFKIESNKFVQYTKLVMGGVYPGDISLNNYWYELNNGNWYARMPPWYQVHNMTQNGCVRGHLEKGSPVLAVKFPSWGAYYFDIDIDRKDGQQQKLERLMEIFGAQSDQLLLLYRKASGGLSLLGRIAYLLPWSNGSWGICPYPIKALHDELKVICAKAEIQMPELFPSGTKPRRLPFQGGKNGHLLIDPQEYLLKWAPEISDYHDQDDESFRGQLGESLIRSDSNVILFEGDRDLALDSFLNPRSIDLPCVIKKAAAIVKAIPSGIMHPSNAATKYQKKMPPIGRATLKKQKIKRAQNNYYRDTATQLWDSGLQNVGTRNHAIMVLASDCYHQGLSPDMAVEKIEKWYLDGKTNGLSREYQRNPSATIKKVKSTVDWVYKQQSALGLRPRSTPLMEPLPLTIEEFSWLVERLKKYGLSANNRSEKKTIIWAYEFYQLIKPQLIANSTPEVFGSTFSTSVRVSALRLRALKYGSGNRYLTHIEKLSPLLKPLKRYVPSTNNKPGLPSAFQVLCFLSSSQADEQIPLWRPASQVLKMYGLRVAP